MPSGVARRAVPDRAVPDRAVPDRAVPDRAVLATERWRHVVLWALSEARSISGRLRAPTGTGRQRPAVLAARPPVSHGAVLVPPAVAVLLALLGGLAVGVRPLARVISGPVGLAIVVGSLVAAVALAPAGQGTAADRLRGVPLAASVVAVELVAFVAVVRFFFIR